MFLPLLLFLQLSRLTLTSSASPLLQVKPGCQANCGTFAVTYPFGIGPNENGCSFNGDGYFLYNVTCDTSYHPPKPFLWLGANRTSGQNNMVELISISETEVRVKILPSTVCYEYKTGNVTFDAPVNYMAMRRTPFTVSSTRNKLFGIGCYSMAAFYDPSNVNLTNCITTCKTKEKILDGNCSGNGCCQVPLPKGIKLFLSIIDSMDPKSESISFSPCSSAFVCESDKYTFKATDLDGSSFRTKGRDVPVVLDWAIGNKTCKEAQKDLSTFACKKNSNCRNSDKVLGYICTCNTGFVGNPYLSPGCQDVNECEDQDNNPCEEICKNTMGSYTCTCPEGSRGDGTKRGSGCIQTNKADFPIVKVALGIGLGFLFLIVATTMIYFSIRRKKLNQLIQKKFQQNGGLLLKEKLASYEGGVEATKIFTAKELELATKNYSDKLILGRGGFGTVYKGTLPDGRIVAIKKSKIVDDTQIEQFINEIVILTHVNHRNVVKVLGCCLEADVPLLVYEYVSNGTLFQHIHNKENGETSLFLSWQVRLRIATESAGALAYLHSATSVPIIHRDIKSANILLDENYTAKIADFGASRLNSLDQTQIDTLVKGTLGYLDPEYFSTNLLTNKSDVYSFGVVLLELLTGEKSLSFTKFQEQRSLATYFILAVERDELFNIIEPQIANEEKRDELIAFTELSLRCLNSKGGERPTMKEVSAELESLSKVKTRPSGVYNQQSHEQKSNSNSDEQADLYSVPISSTSGESGQYSTDKDLFPSINMPRLVRKLTADEVIFDPYRDARNQGLIQRRDDVVLYYGPLLFSNGFSMYDPHRVMRQLGYIQEEPHFDAEPFFKVVREECSTSQKGIDVRYAPAPVNDHWNGRRDRKVDTSLLDEVTEGHEAHEKYITWYLGWARPTVIREQTAEQLARKRKMAAKDPATSLKFFKEHLKTFVKVLCCARDRGEPLSIEEQPKHIDYASNVDNEDAYELFKQDDAEVKREEKARREAQAKMNADKKRDRSRGDGSGSGIGGGRDNAKRGYGRGRGGE